MWLCGEHYNVVPRCKDLEPVIVPGIGVAGLLQVVVGLEYGIERIANSRAKGVAGESGASDGDGKEVLLGLSFLNFDAFEVANLIVTPLGINAGNVCIQIILVGSEVVSELRGCFVGGPPTVP